MNFGSRSDPLTGYWQALTDDGEPASDRQPVLFYIETTVLYSSVGYEFVFMHGCEFPATRPTRRIGLHDDDGHLLSVNLLDRRVYKRGTITIEPDWDRIYGPAYSNGKAQR